MSIRKIETDRGTKWEIRYHLNGRGSKRIKRAFDTKREAEDCLSEWHFKKRELEKMDPTTCSFEDTTFREEAEYWQLANQHIFSPGHAIRAKGVLSELLPRIGDFQPNRLHAGYLTRLQSEQLAKELSPATVNRKLEIIRAILSFSTKQHRIPSNPALGFKKLKEVRDGVGFWERKDAESFLAFANAKYPVGSELRWVYVVYLLSINTSLRAGEIWGLRFEDIQQNGDVILIRRQFDRIKREFRPTKGKKDRLVPCNAELLKEILALKNQGRSSSSTVFFEKETGEPICHDNFKKRKFDRDLEKWRGKRIRFHDMRHTGTTLMIGEGLDLKTVQEICGHKDLKTTLNYTHLLGDNIRQAARTFAVMPAINSEGPSKPTLRLIKNS